MMGVLLLVHLGAMTLLMAISVSGLARLIIWALLGWSLYRSLRQHAWRAGPSAVVAIEMDGEGVVSVRFAGSDDWHICQITSRLVHPWLTLMSLRLESHRWPVNLAIAADGVEPEPFRRWRAALRLHTAVA